MGSGFTVGRNEGQRPWSGSRSPGVEPSVTSAPSPRPGPRKGVSADPSDGGSRRRPAPGRQPDQAGDQQSWEVQLGREAQHAGGRAGLQKHGRHDLPNAFLERRQQVGAGMPSPAAFTSRATCSLITAHTRRTRPDSGAGDRFSGKCFRGRGIQEGGRHRGTKAALHPESRHMGSRVPHMA